MISNLLSEIESYTLRNVQEREQVRSPVDRSLLKSLSHQRPNSWRLKGIRSCLVHDGGGEDADSRPPPEDPFEAVVTYTPPCRRTP